MDRPMSANCGIRNFLNGVFVSREAPNGSGHTLKTARTPQFPVFVSGGVYASRAPAMDKYVRLHETGRRFRHF